MCYDVGLSLMCYPWWGWRTKAKGASIYFSEGLAEIHHIIFAYWDGHKLGDTEVEIWDDINQQGQVTTNY